MSLCLGTLAKGYYLASNLYDAIEDRDFGAVSYALAEKHTDPNILLPNGISPLHLALGNDDPVFALQATKLIMQHGGNPNLRTDDGLTPLHIASAWGRYELVQLLVCCGADPELRDYCNAMPIDYAAENKHRDIVSYLHYVAYCGPTFADLEDRPDFNYTLDKIIVNNGVAEAQYEVDKSSKSLRDLEQLPKASPTELVQNWCTKHIINRQTDTGCNSFEIVPDDRFVNCDRRNRKECDSLEFECSSKFSSKRSLPTIGVDIPTIAKDFKFAEESQESGIAILPDDASDDCVIIESGCVENSIKRHRDASSDYFTCNEISGSSNILEKNISDGALSFLDNENVTKTFGTTCGFRDEGNLIDRELLSSGVAMSPSENANIFECTEGSNTDSRLNVIEVYKYTDEQEGIVLLENRLLVKQKSDEDDSYQSQSSKLTSLPASFEYDTDTLRSELIRRGFHPGPITKTTKRVYLRKLFRIKSAKLEPEKKQPIISNRAYSKELEKTLSGPYWLQDLSPYKNLEETVSKEFSNPGLTRRWREGIGKSSFTYLLLDPRVTNNLPVRRDSLTLEETWRAFISSIFYVGKGKRSRPYAHLYEAVISWNKGAETDSNQKLKQIINIWKEDAGVVCLHVFQNVIPCEAYTREAAMIKALKVKNIANKKSGDFYGTACTWTSKQQKMLGTFLLYKAMLIFLNEGERQLKPADIV